MGNVWIYILIILPEFVDETFENHFKKNQSHEEYHADKTAINSSTLKLSFKSDAAVYAHYLVQEPTQEEIEEEGEEDELPTTKTPDHLKLGSALHAAALEPVRFYETLIQEPKFSGKGMKARKAEWLASQPANATILKPKLYLQTEGMVNSFLARTEIKNLLMMGIPEMSGYYRHPDTGIKCKVRPDLWDEGNGILVDIKTTRNSSDPQEFWKDCKKYRYDLSMAMYADGIAHITGSRPAHCFFLVIEKTPPYECSLLRMTERMLQRGHEEYIFAMQKLEFCLKTGIWKSRQAALATVWEDFDYPDFMYKKKENEIYE